MKKTTFSIVAFALFSFSVVGQAFSDQFTGTGVPDTVNTYIAVSSRKRYVTQF